jgi:hypothetical protein
MLNLARLVACREMLHSSTCKFLGPTVIVQAHGLFERVFEFRFHASNSAGGRLLGLFTAMKSLDGNDVLGAAE